LLIDRVQYSAFFIGVQCYQDSVPPKVNRPFPGSPTIISHREKSEESIMDQGELGAIQIFFDHPFSNLRDLLISEHQLDGIILLLQKLYITIQI
jgi:hypothetical protein